MLIGVENPVSVFFCEKIGEIRGQKIKSTI